MKWLWLLIGLLIVELLILVAIGRALGVVTTFVLLFVIGIVGAAFAKSAGSRVFQQWREALHRGEVPQEGLLDGALVLAAGALLLMPGILTDVLGALLLVPPVRRFAAIHVRRRLERRFRQRGAPGVIDVAGSVIDVEGEVVDAERKVLPPNAQR